jgi:hypothetical protein|tara:strand:+ start:258 stop:413 length:156 start_codon:yes stop_codon:yes gene_type:complete
MTTEADKYNLRVEILNLTLQREWEEFKRVEAEDAVLNIERQIREKKEKLNE